MNSALLAILLALQIVTLLAMLLLWRRRPVAVPDPQLQPLLAADVPARLTRMDARAELLEGQLRAGLAQLRTDLADEAQRTRTDSKSFDDQLRNTVVEQMAGLGNGLGQRLSTFTADTGRNQNDARESLDRRLTELMAANTALQDRLRTAVEQGLSKISEDNRNGLEKMRETVDEKLQKTLHTRLDQSFGLVSEQLNKVHAGLGEMNMLTTGVNDLNRIFSNVKSRGGFAEVQLGKLLEQVLAPGQYAENVNVRPGTQEVVEFAVRFPGSGGEVLLPIDAKFPREDWERLETAYESNDAPRIEASRRAFDAAIRTEGKRICSKYINEPVTTPYAIMFLPTEGLYAEVMRRDGLQADLHLNCRVMVAGPANLYALLTSFQLGFKMLNLQKKGDEVWNILGRTQTEFKTFETLMGSMEKQVGTVQNTIQKLNTRTRAINRTLRDVSADAAPSTASFAGFDGVLPMLAASEDGDE